MGSVTRKGFLVYCLLPLLAFAQTPAPHSEHPLVKKALPRTQLTGDWGGARTNLDRCGIDLNASVIGVPAVDLGGGKKRGFAMEYLFDANFRLKSEPLLHYSGGYFYADFQAHRGVNPTTKLVGSVVQVDDPVDAYNFTQLSELWYQQKFSQGRLWIKVGKSDAITEFDNSVIASAFLNAGIAEISSLVFFPTYPDPAMGAVVSVQPLHGLSLTAAVFDGSLAEGIHTGQRGPDRFFDHLSSHVYLIGEADANWNFFGLPGMLGVGGWGIRAHMKQFDGDPKRVTSGAYFLANQSFWHSRDTDLSLFVQGGFASPEISPVRRTIAGGMLWRRQDSFGLAMQSSVLSHEPGSGFTKHAETAIEIFYKCTPLLWLALQPDLQYIIHPGGKGAANAVVAILQTTIAF